MRVVQINTDSDFGSVSAISIHLAEELNESRNECRVLFGRGKPGNAEFAERFALNWETALHGIQTRLLGIHAQGSIISTCRLLHMLEKYQPDIIHLHNAHGYYLNLYMLLDYVARRNIAMVWTFHDAWPFTGHCAYFYDCKKWMTGCGGCSKKAEYPQSLIFDRSAAEWQKKYKAIQKLKRLIVVTPSQWLADMVNKSFFAGKNVRTINNGIDIKDIFYPRDTMQARREFGIPLNKYVFNVVLGGFNDWRKGGHHLKELVLRFSDKPVHFAAAGWKEPTDALPFNLTVLPVISSPERMADFYSMADAFMLLSEADNFPTVSIESLACGTPVIGFTVGGAPEQVDVHTGKMVPLGQVDELEKVIAQFITGSCTFSRDQCRVRAEMLYSTQKMIDGYMRCYRDVISL